jgi:hypothetical protein
MLRTLAAFKSKHGHCNVPTDYADDPQLGRWVAAHRYKRRVGDLPAQKVRELDKLGFIWQPSDHAWEKMFRSLKEFKSKRGHCNVPEDWPKNQSLANWVQSQRHRRRKGKLPADRVKRLDGIDFLWAIYKTDRKKPPPAESAPVEPPETVPSTVAERLYAIRNGVYVQHCGRQKMPPEIEQYIAAHGELPPYIPLPTIPTVFALGIRYVREKMVRWRGKGPLPREVLLYVQKNGTLPPRA